MLLAGRAWALLTVVLLCLPAWGGELSAASKDVRGIVHWIFASGDTSGRAFAVVDKKDATIWVFDDAGRLAGTTPVLLGAARGDHSVPGIGDRTPDGILPHERTTPAGRFESAPGRNLSGEHVVWVDYDAAVAIHRVRPNMAEALRLQRLASASADDNRVSLGCIVVPPAFYDNVVRPVLGQRRGVVYVLPETVPAQTLFAGLMAG